MTDNPLVRGRYRPTYREVESVILAWRLWNTLYTIPLTDNEINTEMYTVSSTTNRVITPISNAL